MKSRIIYITLATLALGLGSCSVIDTVSSKLPGGKSSSQVAAKEVKASKEIKDSKEIKEIKESKAPKETKDSKVAKKKEPTKKGGQDIRPEAVLPHDRENIAAAKELKAYTSEEIGRGVVKGDWAIETVMGKEAIGEDAPFIKLVPEELKFYGNNGCNVINGDYRYNSADSTIRFSNLIATMKLCGKTGITDTDINIALDSARKYSWEIKDTDYYLYFYDSAGKQVMSLMHQNFEFLNGTWSVAEIDGVKTANTQMQLVIDVAEGKLHGNTGCNIMNGSFETDMNAANSISFSAIATTRMACPDQTSETALLVALEEASTAKPISRDEVILYDSQRNPVLKLKRIKN